MQADDTRLLELIREVLKRSPFHTEGTKKVHRRLKAWLQVKAGRARVNRLMREAGLLSPQRIEADRSEKTHEGTLIPENIDNLSRNPNSYEVSEPELLRGRWVSEPELLILR